jgi:hypothetical protein
MASSSSNEGSGSAPAPPKATLFSVPLVLFIFKYRHSSLPEAQFHLSPKIFDLISPSLLMTRLGSPCLDKWVILTLLRWSTLKLAEYLSSMLLWTWPIGTVVLGLGQAMSKGGEIGNVGYRLKTEVSGRSVRSANASPCPCLIWPGTNPF